MEERGYRLSAEVCSMPAEAADKLIESGDGDCALLYIYFARRGAPRRRSSAARWE